MLVVTNSLNVGSGRGRENDIIFGSMVNRWLTMLPKMMTDNH